MLSKNNIPRQQEPSFLSHLGSFHCRPQQIAHHTSRSTSGSRPRLRHLEEDLCRTRQAGNGQSVTRDASRKLARWAQQGNGMNTNQQRHKKAQKNHIMLRSYPDACAQTQSTSCQFKFMHTNMIQHPNAHIIQKTKKSECENKQTNNQKKEQLKYITSVSNSKKENKKKCEQKKEQRRWAFDQQHRK